MGGKGQNVYHLDKLTDVACVIDLGGNDGYADGATTLERPVLIVIDLEGNDLYRSSKPAVQGGPLLGVSMLLDMAGDDKYQALDLAQGSAMAGVGMLIDYAGDDDYRGLRRVQRTSHGRAGHSDRPRRQRRLSRGHVGARLRRPVGLRPVGRSVTANDHYYCGGSWRDSYPETPGYEGWGQGVGAGIRQVADGGIGVILDGGGDDVYEFDYLSHGGGYWCGRRLRPRLRRQRSTARSRGNRISHGTRTEPKFQRFGCGWGCHYSLGFCFDDKGNDVYEGTIMGSGMGWDCSVGFLFDFGGDDSYQATGGLTQGTGAQASLGVLFDYDGADVYRGYGQGYASPSISYHDLPGCGGNFSFCIDYGGEDKYGCGARNNCFIQRGSDAGFLVDRPRREEVERTADKNEHGSRHEQEAVNQRDKSAMV